MSQCHSKRLGWIDYTEESVVEFPVGLPAFEDERAFVLVEREETAPVTYLQSLATEELCFLTVPAQLLRPGYEIRTGPEERELLGGDGVEDLLVLALLTLPESGLPTANLMAPLVVHRRTRRACQMIQAGSDYSFEEQLAAQGEAACS